MRYGNPTPEVAYQHIQHSKASIFFVIGTSHYGFQDQFILTKKDFDTLIDGLILAGEIYLEAGADLVMPNSFSYYEFKNKNELARLKDLIQDNSDITLGTGHPQGGNVISADESKGVVNPELKVWGYSNLYVCDASVFPSSLGVNPQISVMTMAEYAVPFVAANNG